MDAPATLPDELALAKRRSGGRATLPGSRSRDSIAGYSDDAGRRAAVRKRLAEIRSGLEPEGMIEELLTERVLMAWMDCAYADVMSVATMHEAELARRADFWQRRAGRAQRRLIQACKAWTRSAAPRQRRQWTCWPVAACMQLTHPPPCPSTGLRACSAGVEDRRDETILQVACSRL